MTIARRWKFTATGILLLPISFLLLFLIGESVGGIRGAIVHLLQLIPLIILLSTAWRWPKIGGTLLTSLALILGTAYLVTTRLSMQAIITVELILFIPILISGTLFIISARS